jgi:uncharacterized membrane protein YhhN
MSYNLLGLALVMAIVDWVAVWKVWRRVEMVAKPSVILALLVWLWQNWVFNDHLAWFALGLGLSLIGDVLLYPWGERFLAGLIAFALAHLAYIVGFNPTLPPLNLASLALALTLALPGSQIYRHIAAGLEASRNARLKPAVLVYILLIELMLLSALLALVRSEWLALPALLASSGALLFCASDTLLAWNKFVASLPQGRVPSTICYHLGQMLLTLGAVLHFLGQG